MFCSETKKNESPRAWTVILIVVQLRACLTSQLYRSGCTLGGTGVHFFWSSSAVEAKELVSLTDQQSYLRLSLRPQYGLCASHPCNEYVLWGTFKSRSTWIIEHLNSGMVRSQSTIWRKCEFCLGKKMQKYKMIFMQRIYYKKSKRSIKIFFR